MICGLQLFKQSARVPTGLTQHISRVQETLRYRPCLLGTACQSGGWQLCLARALKMAPAARAFVGEQTASAAEYHCNDFAWEDHRAEVEAQLVSSSGGVPPVQALAYDPATWERCAAFMTRF